MINKEKYERALDVRNSMQTANDTISYANIKGKDYAEVKERIRAFRMVYPEGCIKTEIVELDENHCVIRACVLNESGDLLATGHAHETFGSSNINRTSMLENAETSAVGRALGLFGMGIKGAVASAQEIQRADAIEKKRNSLLICHRCGREIIDTADKKGKVWAASDIAHMTMKAYGDTLCLPCVADIKSMKTEAES